MKYLDCKLWMSVVVIGMATLWLPSGHAATPAAWKDTGFAINATDMTLREVLREFGLAYGVRVEISVKSDMPMKGKLKSDSGSEFLDRLTQAYQFRWFVYNDTLYVVPRNENASMRLEVGEDAVQDAKAALIGLGLFDSRFGWGELPEEGTVVVSGPRAYVELARDILMPDKKASSLKGRQIMMFRLKYASAMDRVITVRDKSETIPGIKTVLTNLLGTSRYENNFAGDHFDASSKKKSHTPPRGRGMSRDVEGRRENLETVEGEHAPRHGSHQREQGPRIDADPSLNAIFIYDDVSKRVMYQTLITELDVEPQQIEIEALIVDINRSQLSDMGVEWGVATGNRTLNMNAGREDTKGLDLPLPGATLLITNASRFYARLKALQDSGEARVLGKPTVLTLDNVAAVLDLSQTTYLPLVGERVADLADVTAGTKLRVVPRVVREGASTRVRMEIDIEDGNLGESVGTSTNVTRSSISTQAIIEPMQTLMIGGYHSESRTKNLQKVPLLGDVPLVGGLFRHTTESAADRERLFLITPRLTGKTGVRAADRSRANRFMRSAPVLEMLEAPQEPAPAVVPALVATAAPTGPLPTTPPVQKEEMDPVIIDKRSLRVSTTLALDAQVPAPDESARQADAPPPVYIYATPQGGILLQKTIELNWKEPETPTWTTNLYLG